MRYSKPVSENVETPYSSIAITGCSPTNVEFILLSDVPQTTERRYCNKILVHECISAPESDPVELERVELIATSDPCYSVFEIFKSSDVVEGADPTIDLVLDEDDLVTNVLVRFTAEETCGLPITLAYKLYGYPPDDEDRILLSRGSLKIVPCPCCGCSKVYWTEIQW